MKTLFLSMMLCGSACAGPFFGQQGVVAASPSGGGISGFDFADYFTPVLSIIPQQDPALSDGVAASTVTDLSGNGVDFTQSTSAARPTWKTGATATGMASLLYDGVDDWLTAGDKLDLRLNSRTLFLAFKRNSGSCGILVKSLFSSAGGRWASSIDAGSAYGFWTSGGTAYIASASNTDTSWQVLTVVLNRNAGVIIRKNGVQIASSGSFESAVDQNTTYSLMMGAYNNSTDGLTPVSGYYLNGEIAAVGVADSALSTGTLESVEDALGDYLGITITH